MDNLILVFFVSFFVAYVSIPVIIRISSIKKLVDVPDSRKIHKTPVPSLGGIGIFAGFILALLIFVPYKASAGMQYYIAAAFLIFLIGLKDDVLVISPLKKFVGQLVVAFIVVNLAGLRLVSMHGIFGINDLPYAASLALTYFAIIVIINAYNLIDGVDGLAGSLGVISSLIFGVYFYFAKDTLFAMMGLSLVGGLAAFLVFNITPAKIFMGDTGSMLVGLINAVLVLHFIRVADTPGAVVPVVSAPLIGLAILIVPLFDTLRVFTVRVFLQRRSPFSADKNHIHHILLDCGLSHSAVTLTLAIYSLVLIAASFLLKGVGNHMLLAGLMLVCITCTGLATFFRQLKKPFLHAAEISEEIPADEDGVLIEAPAIMRMTPQKGGAVVSAGIQPAYSLEEE